MWRKSTQRTSSAGDMSHTSFHSGLPSAFAHRSHTALTSAAVARWIAPFSGPIQRSCESPVTVRQKRPGSAATSARRRPATRGASARIAATTISVPRPIVNVMPWPERPASVASTTYAAE